MSSASTMESDEAFARRLQAQEMGIRLPPDAQTPLINAGEPHENPTVLNARLNELAGTRLTVYAICFFYTPQIIAAIVILPMHWGDEMYCGESSERWRWWVLLSAVRMALFAGSALLLYVYRDWLVTRQREMDRLTSLRNATDVTGLLWFVIGNMWFFSKGNSCSDAIHSSIYWLGCIMIAFNYLQICLPCILALLLIPVFCCCMPCLIRALARFQAPRQPKGATDAAIELLPLHTIQDTTEGIEGSCPICLNDMIVGDEVRVLTCKHIFHKMCLDEWLRVNASCPTCRTSIFEARDGNERPAEAISTSQHGVQVETSGGGSRANQHRLLLSEDDDD